MRPNTNIVFTEAPTNPYLRVIDLAGVVKVAKKHKAMTIIDATLASPYNLRPLEMGIDVVIHSATKYFGGHNDLMAGVTMGKHDLLNDLYRMQRMIGAVPGPFTCFLLERGLKTFGLRMEQHNRAGLAVARMLESHPKVEKVWYPGLASHPDHMIAKKQMKGFGSVITFLIKGGGQGDEEVHRFPGAVPDHSEPGRQRKPSVADVDDVVLRLSRGVQTQHRHGGQPRAARARAGGHGGPDRRSRTGARKDLNRPGETPAGAAIRPRPPGPSWPARPVQASTRTLNPP